MKKIIIDYNNVNEQFTSVSKQNIGELEKELKNMLHTFQLYCIESIFKKINKKQIKNVVLIAHHPLVYYKVKSKESKDESPKMSLANSEYIALCKNIYDYFNKDTQLFYNSADLHLYQEGNINLKSEGDDEIHIRQYIAGTGGNTLEDKYVELGDLKDNNYKYEYINGITIGYKMNNTIKSNGFLHWNEDIEKKKLSINFITA